MAEEYCTPTKCSQQSPTAITFLLVQQILCSVIFMHGNSCLHDTCENISSFSVAKHLTCAMGFVLVSLYFFHFAKFSRLHPVPPTFKHQYQYPRLCFSTMSFISLSSAKKFLQFYPCSTEPCSNVFLINILGICFDQSGPLLRTLFIDFLIS